MCVHCVLENTFTYGNFKEQAKVRTHAFINTGFSICILIFSLKGIHEDGQRKNVTIFVKPTYTRSFILLKNKKNGRGNKSLDVHNK